MKTLSILVFSASLLLSISSKAEDSSDDLAAEKRSIEEFVSPDGRIDIEAVRKSGHQGPLDLDAEHSNGIYVRRVYPGSAADRASISRGTIILQVDEVVVRTLKEMEDSIQRLRKSSRAIGLIVQEPDGTIARKVIRR